MNIMHISGRLVADPEIRYGKNDIPVATFTIATNEGKDKEGKEISEFVRCVAYKKTAELIDRFFLKGYPIILHGKWHNNSYEKDGKKHYITECIVRSVEFQLGKPVNARDIDEPGDSFSDMEGGELPF